MHIFIPTMRRPRLQYTLNELREESPYPITLVVPHNELADYHGVHDNIISTPEDISGIAATRQWIMEQAPEEHVLMMDDDLTFAVRRTDDPTRFREPNTGEIRHMLEEVDNLLYLCAHVGIATREGANRNTDKLLSCTRAPRVIGYQRSTFFKEGVDFRNSTVMDDFEATLHLLTRGYTNSILNSYVQNQRGSGTAGGASTYRTLEMHRAAAEKLQSRYPQFVKTVEKTTKTAWGGATRTDVIIQWKKALQHGLAIRSARLLDK
jgi:hypothetical protein